MIMKPSPMTLLRVGEHPSPGPLRVQSVPGPPRGSVLTTADEAGDAGGDLGFLLEEAVWRAADARVDAALGTRGQPGTAGHRDDLLSHAVGVVSDPGRHRGRRAQARVGRVADDQHGHADLVQWKVEDRLR